MELRVTLRGGAHDGPIEVTVPEGATVADLARRLAAPAQVRGCTDARLTLRVLGRSRGREDGWSMLAPDADVRESGLRSGDEVEPVVASDARDETVAAVEVVRGPDRGSVFALRPGVNVVGRDPSASVTLTDPLVAGRHLAVRVSASVEVQDLGSTGGVAISGTPATRAPWRPGEALALGSSVLRLVRVVPSDAAAASRVGDVVTSAPKVLPRLPEEAVDLPEPPTMPEVRSMPRAALLAPAFMGLAMFAATGRALSLVFVFMSPLVMLAGVLDSRWERRRRRAELSAEFDAALEDATARLAAREPHERSALGARFPAVHECEEIVVARGSALWARRPEHAEFLAVRLGTGAVPASAPPTAAQGGMALPDARPRVEQVASRYATVPKAPVTAHLTVCGSLGFAGEGGSAAARAAILQLAVLHPPSELALAVLASDGPGDESWDWMGWLPHVRAARALLGGDAAVSGQRRGALMDSLEDLVARRAGVGIAAALPAPRADEADGIRAVPGRPSLVVLVHDAEPVERERLLRLAERGPDHGVHVIWVAEDPSRIPGACRTVLHTAAGQDARVGQVLRGAPADPVEAERASLDGTRRVARMLAPLSDAAAVASKGAALPRAVPLVELHGAEVLDPEVHASRWREATRGGARGSLRALVGHSAEGPEYLDLASQGPHALVGGTTGSGKSELLQAWILGMACAHGPDVVNFLLVDYKGGAAFSECVRLPHAVGLVTDLDARLAERVLVSLRAELTHRERLLADAAAKDLDALLAAGRSTLPRLVVVIDEFATLVSEVPAFIDGVLDIAQRGRSLGLHLIMATQRPAGVIRDSLRANTNLRLALRMADDADSRDVLGEASAAGLDPGTPGRVLVRHGPGRVRQLQSAYGGASTAALGPRTVRLPVRDASLAGGGPWPEPAAPAPAPSFGTDAERVVDALREAHRLSGQGPARRPWLDELPDCLALEALSAAPGGLTMGLLDDPGRQRQVPLSHRLDDGPLLVIGGPASGASAALRTLAAAAAAAPDRAALHVYCIDGGGGGLAPLRHLPHVGDVLEHTDAERIARLLARLAAAVRERKAVASEGDAPQADEVAVLLLIDDAVRLQEELLHVPGREVTWEDLRAVLSDGRTAGVHVAATAARTGALHASLRAVMTRLLTLRTTDEAEYALAGLRSKRVPSDAPPGRGLDAASGLEFQIAVPGGSPRLDRQVAALRSSLPAPSVLPPPVPRMPTRVEAAEMPPEVQGMPVLGIEEQTLRPMGVEIDRAFLIAGPAGSGRTAAAAWLATAMRAARPSRRLLHLSLRRSRLGELSAWDDSCAGVDAAGIFLTRWAARLEAPAEPEDAIVVVVEHLEDLGPGTPDPRVVQTLRHAMKAGHAVVGEADTQSWLGPLAADIRSARRGLVLGAEPADVQFLLGVRGTRLPDGPPPGRGVVIAPGSMRVVQVPWLPEAFSTEPPGPRRPVDERG
ncbi:FtsK/SpoIIIE domain-containing protein [Demequina zhanjiangensis]|uniref:FtsK/SpoIIIE domain-containing protein n=1 Tax=Demequina zhanjiangensis TaxID=3051659 RepID=A0ABT8FX39_9MICO|nr:FtsK/SpoIIIE domain-containing protein [Demequina sp. SYSU T00b26]MDN4471466.1 FtsK/SpoIIIE domain-containing protein [Demequina sp. SYSU T00b26]